MDVGMREKKPIDQLLSLGNQPGFEPNTKGLRLANGLGGVVRALEQLVRLVHTLPFQQV